MRKITKRLLGWKGICSNAGKFVPLEEGFRYVCDRVGIKTFDECAPEADGFEYEIVEWYFSGNWIEVYEEDV